MITEKFVNLADLLWTDDEFVISGMARDVVLCFYVEMWLPLSWDITCMGFWWLDCIFLVNGEFVF